jgi:hypothetical protein
LGVVEAKLELQVCDRGEQPALEVAEQAARHAAARHEDARPGHHVHVRRRGDERGQPEELLGSHGTIRVQERQPRGLGRSMAPAAPDGRALAAIALSGYVEPARQL